ncbi:hypothetical protein [Lentimicrobium sp.]
MEGGRVNIRISRQPDRLTVEVQDTGIE